MTTFDPNRFHVPEAIAADNAGAAAQREGQAQREREQALWFAAEKLAEAGNTGGAALVAGLAVETQVMSRVALTRASDLTARAWEIENSNRDAKGLPRLPERRA